MKPNQRPVFRPRLLSWEGLSDVKLQTIKSEGLAHNSYLLSDEGEAVVIDPRRDCDVYIELAERECTKIKYILETHRNEDYVAGSLELHNKVEAEIGHSKGLPFKYGEHSLSNGDTLNVGSLKIKTMETYGHTNESLCYAVYETLSSDALMVFSGDTLFAGSVGRTDLYGKTEQPIQARRLYTSLYEKLLPLGDHVVVYPAHGAGSVCGRNIGGQEPTTIGYEKKNNSYLQLSSEDFVIKSCSEQLVVPRYFLKMEEYNLNGPPLLSELTDPKALPLEEFEEEMQEPLVIVMDTRMNYAFAGSHIPDSLSMWLGGTSAYPGWLFDVKQYFVFIHERPSDMDLVSSRLRRLGFDNMCGYLCGGMAEWQQAGKPITTSGVISAAELKNKLGSGEVVLLDVREPSEWKDEGIVEGAICVFFADLPDRLASLPKDKPLAVTCSVGNRASIAVSLLERAGVKESLNVLGGMDAWTSLGYPVKK